MPTLDDTLQVSTPESVSFGYQIAGIGSRFLAALVDSLLIGLLQIIANVALIAAIPSSPSSGVLPLLEKNMGWLPVVIGLISFFFLWGYYIFFELIWNGQTPGKRIFHLRVIRVDGTPITLAESLVRNLVRLIDFLPLYYGVGVVTMFINAQFRRLGDLAAGTLVVHDTGGKVTLQSLEAQPPSTLVTPTPGLTPLPEVNLQSLPLEKLTEAEYRLVDEFLMRRASLANDHALARVLVRRLWDKMELPPESMPRGWYSAVLEAIAQARK